MLTSNYARWSESPFSDSSGFDAEELMIPDDDTDATDEGRSSPVNMDIDLKDVWGDSQPPVAASEFAHSLTREFTPPLTREFTPPLTCEFAPLLAQPPTHEFTHPPTPEFAHLPIHRFAHPPRHEFAHPSTPEFHHHHVDMQNLPRMDGGWTNAENSDEAYVTSNADGATSVERGDGERESVGETSEDEARRRHAQWADNVWSDNEGPSRSHASPGITAARASWDQSDDSDRTVRPAGTASGAIQLARYDRKPKRPARHPSIASASQDSDAEDAVAAWPNRGAKPQGSEKVRILYSKFRGARQNQLKGKLRVSLWDIFVSVGLTVVQDITHKVEDLERQLREMTEAARLREYNHRKQVDDLQAELLRRQVSMNAHSGGGRTHTSSPSLKEKMRLNGFKEIFCAVRSAIYMNSGVRITHKGF
jgi:hypothetical protein